MISLASAVGPSAAAVSSTRCAGIRGATLGEGDLHARLTGDVVINDIHGHDPAREVFAKRGKPFAFRQHLRRKVLQKRGLGQVGTPFRMSDAYKIAQSGMVCNA